MSQSKIKKATIAIREMAKEQSWEHFEIKATEDGSGFKITQGQALLGLAFYSLPKRDSITLKSLQGHFLASASIA
ncbi:MAG: hypothetical protein HGA61_01075 [Candidatus Moranbacteria bacterium]|nr:hypothetical protein [Candidatus Moranbacteria bacterium]